MSPGVGIEHLLRASEQLLVDDSLVLSRIDRLAVNDLSKVDAVAQHVEQRSAAERLATCHLAGSGDPALRENALLGKFTLQGMHRAEVEVPGKYVPYGRGTRKCPMRETSESQAWWRNCQNEIVCN